MMADRPIVELVDAGQALHELLERLPVEVVDAVLGAWMARRHRQRPRLMWQRPDSPAKAPHFLAFVRELPCAGTRCGAPAPSEPHHHGRRGIAQKCDDYRTTPTCRDCHDATHRGDGLTHVEQLAAQVDTLVLYLRIVEQT